MSNVPFKALQWSPINGGIWVKLLILSCEALPLGLRLPLDSSHASPLSRAAPALLTFVHQAPPCLHVLVEHILSAWSALLSASFL